MNDYRVARRRIDHVVMAVHDLRRPFLSATRFPGRCAKPPPLGDGKSPHSIQNVLYRTVGSDPKDIPPHKDRQFSFGGFVYDYLRAREGLAIRRVSTASLSNTASARRLPKTPHKSLHAFAKMERTPQLVSSLSYLPSDCQLDWSSS